MLAFILLAFLYKAKNCAACRMRNVNQRIRDQQRPNRLVLVVLLMPLAFPIIFFPILGSPNFSIRFEKFSYAIRTSLG